MKLVTIILSSPYRLFHWLFRHNPWITFIELIAFSAIHGFIIYPLIIFFYGETGYFSEWIRVGFHGKLPWIFMGFMGFLSTSVTGAYLKHGGKLEVNDYDVLALSVKEYLQSRGFGIFAAYVFVAFFSIFIWAASLPLVLLAAVFIK